MPSYRYLEHRSDLLIEGSGHSFPEAVESVAEGLFHSISSTSSVSSNPVKVKFSESGIDTQDLVINVFTRVLAEMDSQSKIGISLKVVSLDEKAHKAVVELSLSDGKARLQVKAVTFHEFLLSKSKTGPTTLRVLFDV